MTQQSTRHGVSTAGTGSLSLAGPSKQALPPRLETKAPQPTPEPLGRDFWINRLRDVLAGQSPQAHQFAEEGLQAWPTDPEMLMLAALTSLTGRRPERALALLKRYGKRYVPGKPIVLLTALAYAQQGQLARAWAMLEADHLHTDRAALAWFVGDGAMENWLLAHLRDIRVERLRSRSRAKPHRPADPPAASTRNAKRLTNRAPAPRSPPGRATPREAASLVSTLPGIPDLPRQDVRFSLSFEVANPDTIEIEAGVNADAVPFRLRGELVRLSTRWRPSEKY
jgi:hypothetical protein